MKTKLKNMATGQ